MALTYSVMTQLGQQAPDFHLPATDGQTYSLASFAAARALLVVFTCNHCPYARAVEDRLIQLGLDYQAKGLAMVAINSNNAAQYPDDAFDKMVERAREKNFPYPYCHDATQEVARAYQAACTPDPFLFDGNRQLVYRGRIDDNWQEPAKVTRHDLREAIEAVLTGRPVTTDQMASMGCNIKWK